MQNNNGHAITKLHKEWLIKQRREILSLPSKNKTKLMTYLMNNKMKLLLNELSSF